MSSLTPSTQNLETRRQLQCEPTPFADLVLQAAGGAVVNLSDIRLGSLGSRWGRRSPVVSGLNEIIGAQITLDGVASFDQGPFAFGAISNPIELQIQTHSITARYSDEYQSNSLAWLAFTREALKDSRPMTDWERKASADFFWSQFD